MCKKLAVVANQREQAALVAAEHGIEFFEILRQDGNGSDALERAVGGRTPPRQNEKRCAEIRLPGRDDIADIDPGVAGHMHPEIVAVTRVELGRNRSELAWHQ